MVGECQSQRLESNQLLGKVSRMQISMSISAYLNQYILSEIWLCVNYPEEYRVSVLSVAMPNVS